MVPASRHQQALAHTTHSLGGTASGPVLNRRETRLLLVTEFCPRRTSRRIGLRSLAWSLRTVRRLTVWSVPASPCPHRNYGHLRGHGSFKRALPGLIFNALRPSMPRPHSSEFVQAGFHWWTAGPTPWSTSRKPPPLNVLARSTG